MTLDEFDKFADEVLAVTDDDSVDEWYATNRAILDSLLRNARSELFGDALRRQEEYKEYLRLKAIFEGEMK